MGKYLVAAAVCLVDLVPVRDSGAREEEPLVLENDRLGLCFDQRTGTLTAFENKLTGETYRVSGDEFAVEAVGFRLELSEAKLSSLNLGDGVLHVRYQGDEMIADVTYTLGGENHFAEKQMNLIADRDFGLKKVVLSRPTFSADGLKIVEYRYPKFKRPPGTEPDCTFFGRTAKGGFFTGVELPFDVSNVAGQQVVLAYAPSLKVAAGERLRCEPIYFGVYERHSGEQEQEGPLLPSESDAMVAMTSAVLGPPRHGLVPMACGWHSEMEHRTYASEEAVEGDMRSLSFLAECGIDWLSDCHPWGGETDKMNALVGDQQYAPGPLVRKFLEQANMVNVKVVMWPTMNNTHPWWGQQGKPFRSDKPDWLMVRDPKPSESPLLTRNKANCVANKPFLEWLTRINLQGLAAGYYKAWCIDGSFFGDGGWYTSIVPVDCTSDEHDHLPGDSNYACQRALDQLITMVRKQYPGIFIIVCRPPMDLDVWSLRNVDACFTLLESGTDSPHTVGGDRIRKWSRVRVHHHFFPHYLDLPLAFPTRSNAQRRASNWPQGNLDYIMLSALSCSPNQLYYMPTKTGIPDEDKAEIRRWLDWGRKNVAYLKVRKDLPNWPAAGMVDGSAHFVGDRGLVFLFNSDKNFLEGRFALTEEGVGLRQKGTFVVSQDYPESDRCIKLSYGETVRWEVPGETAVVLNVQPID